MLISRFFLKQIVYTKDIHIKFVKLTYIINIYSSATILFPIGKKAGNALRFRN